jgi:hypothetical protein
LIQQPANKHSRALKLTTKYIRQTPRPLFWIQKERKWFWKYANCQALHAILWHDSIDVLNMDTRWSEVLVWEWILGVDLPLLDYLHISLDISYGTTAFSQWNIRSDSVSRRPLGSVSPVRIWNCSSSTMSPSISPMKKWNIIEKTDNPHTHFQRCKNAAGTWVVSPRERFSVFTARDIF